LPSELRSSRRRVSLPVHDPGSALKGTIGPQDTAQEQSIGKIYYFYEIIVFTA
jgi:hypothetical protein